MLTPREKSPLPENFPRGGSIPRRCGQRAQTLPTSYSGPTSSPSDPLSRDFVFPNFAKGPEVHFPNVINKFMETTICSKSMLCMGGEGKGVLCL